jgi:hypothetical protein
VVERLVYTEDVGSSTLSPPTSPASLGQRAPVAPLMRLAPDGDGTLLTLTHEGLPDQAQADSHAAGWSETLEKFGSLA